MTVRADTSRIEISSDRPSDLEVGMELAFGANLAKSCEIGEKDEADGLHILEFKSIYVPDAMFPCPLPADICIDIALEWLKHVKYPPAPDGDGSVKKGFRLTAGLQRLWEPQTLCTIEPTWMIYGK